MPNRITHDEAIAWTEPTKVGANFETIDNDLEAQISSIILARLGARFDTDDWVNVPTTPKLVRTIIAMYYVSYVYDKTYSTDDELSQYAILLRQQADFNIEGLIAGNIDLPEVPEDETPPFGSPSFYPTDASSLQEPTAEDKSLGPAAFSMGTVF